MEKKLSSPVILTDAPGDINPGVGPSYPNMYFEEVAGEAVGKLRKSDGSVIPFKTGGGGVVWSAMFIKSYPTVSTAQPVANIPNVINFGGCVLGFWIEATANAINPGVPGTLDITIYSSYPANPVYHTSIDFAAIDPAYYQFKLGRKWFVPAAPASMGGFAGYCGTDSGILEVKTTLNDLTTFPFNVYAVRLI